MEPVLVGEVPAGAPTADLYVLVEQSGAPFLRVDLYLEYGLGTFSDFRVWGDYLLLGYAEDFDAVHLRTREVKILEMPFYFGSFSTPAEHGRDWGDDILIAASGTHLYRISPTMEVVWEIEHIAVDGIVVDDIDEEIVRISAEQDPPGDWVDYLVDLRVGEWRPAIPRYPLSRPKKAEE